MTTAGGSEAPAPRPRERWEAYWRDPANRMLSAGERLAPYVHKELGMRPGESLYDLGCGAGFAGRWFRDAGLHVTLVDIADNAPGVELDFECLDLAGEAIRRLEPYDWVFCVDVLHHLAPRDLARALLAIARLARKGAFVELEGGLEEWERRAAKAGLRIEAATELADRIELVLRPA